MNEPILHNNILPTEQIKVGPGTKNTNLEKPSGGFHQDQFRDFQIYKNIDELRVKTNQKETYDARNVDGIKNWPSVAVHYLMKEGFKFDSHGNCYVKNVVDSTEYFNVETKLLQAMVNLKSKLT